MESSKFAFFYMKEKKKNQYYKAIFFLERPAALAFQTGLNGPGADRNLSLGKH